MNDSLEKLMADKGDDALEVYLIDIKNYTAREVQAALAELRKRGREYSELQLEYIHRVIKRKLLDEDPNTPIYYSKNAIFMFALFYSVIFAAVLLAMNLKNRREKWVVIGFGITYTIFIFTLIGSFDLSRFVSILFSAVGGIVLQTFFWNRYIGRDIYYKRKPVLFPLLIAIAILVPLVLIYLLTDIDLQQFL